MEMMKTKKIRKKNQKYNRKRKNSKKYLECIKVISSIPKVTVGFYVQDTSA
jgi:hypothetical protein